MAWTGPVVEGVVVDVVVVVVVLMIVVVVVVLVAYYYWPSCGYQDGLTVTSQACNVG